MSTLLITQIVEQVRDLPEAWQQQVLTFILHLRQQHESTDDRTAWDDLASLTGTIDVSVHSTDSPSLSAQEILATTRGSWGSHTLDEIDTLLAHQRKSDWGESIEDEISVRQ
jgi:hypothetical protein